MRNEKPYNTNVSKADLKGNCSEYDLIKNDGVNYLTVKEAKEGASPFWSPSPPSTHTLLGFRLSVLPILLPMCLCHRLEVTEVVYFGRARCGWRYFLFFSEGLAFRWKSQPEDHDP